MGVVFDASTDALTKPITKARFLVRQGCVEEATLRALCLNHPDQANESPKKQWLEGQGKGPN